MALLSLQNQDNIVNIEYEMKNRYNQYCDAMLNKYNQREK